MKIRQSFTLLRQNPFFSVVSIIGTAVSIAFAMVVYMVYDIQTANIVRISS
jgi:putative ABC transport system permease protein